MGKPYISLSSLFGATRTDKLSLKMRIKDNDPLAVDPDVKELLGRVPPFQVGDTLVINYALNIDYFGNIVDKLNAILSLCKKGEVLEGEVSELKNSECLILEVVDKLRQLPKYVVRSTDVVEKVGLHDELPTKKAAPCGSGFYEI